MKKIIFGNAFKTNTWSVSGFIKHGAAAVIALTIGAGPAVAMDPVVFGKSLFNDHCAICHGTTGTGEGDLARHFIVPPKNLQLLAKENGGAFPFSETYQAINGRRVVPSHGNVVMPVWGSRFLASALPKEIHPGVSAEEIVQGRILSVVYYLQTIQE